MDRVKDFFMELGFPAKYLAQAGHVLDAILILIVGLLLIKIFLRIARKALEKSNLDPVLYRFILTSCKVILYIILMLAIVGLFTPNLSGIITVLAAAGAAIALALRDSLANIAGGLIVLLTKPFAQHDLISIEETKGRVQEIDLFVTHLQTENKELIIIPNGKINTSVLINHSKQKKS